MAAKNMCTAYRHTHFGKVVDPWSHLFTRRANAPLKEAVHSGHEGEFISFLYIKLLKTQRHKVVLMFISLTQIVFY